MSGNDVGTLKINYANNQRNAIWRRSGNHSARWLHGEVTIEDKFKIFDGKASLVKHLYFYMGTSGIRLSKTT